MEEDVELVQGPDVFLAKHSLKKQVSFHGETPLLSSRLEWLWIYPREYVNILCSWKDHLGGPTNFKRGNEANQVDGTATSQPDFF